MPSRVLAPSADRKNQITAYETITSVRRAGKPTALATMSMPWISNLVHCSSDCGPAGPRHRLVVPIPGPGLSSKPWPRAWPRRGRTESQGPGILLGIVCVVSERQQPRRRSNSLRVRTARRSPGRAANLNPARPPVTVTVTVTGRSGRTRPPGSSYLVTSHVVTR